ncbi:MAG: carbon storage regulator [Schlesneria sp.]
MLVLSRKPGEKILVGDITITVVRIGPNTVRIGIEAPRSMNIVRAELKGEERFEEVGSMLVEINAEGIGDAETFEIDDSLFGPVPLGTIDMDRVHQHSDTAVSYHGIVSGSEAS